MSMMSGMGRPFEVGETIASFKEYDAAQKAVSRLIAGEVPAADIAIVGTALRSVEKVTGKLGYAQAAWSGAVNGVLLGLLFAAMVVIWTPGLPISAFAGVLLVGIAFGMLFRLIAYAMLRRRRDFASVMQVTADHYEVTVLPRSVAKARQVLGGGGAGVPPNAPAVSAPRSFDEPPRYGVRVDPAPPAVPGAHAAHTGPEAHVPPAPETETPSGAAPSPDAEGTPQAEEPRGEASKDSDRA
ncbi:general stress protein [Microbacterium sp. NPDC096154]|uniref:general stress protein n=1 Tax=Microbacterium sp. NPDC096154 TaxID=3155549 RepID=UPI003320F5A3